MGAPDIALPSAYDDLPSVTSGGTGPTIDDATLLAALRAEMARERQFARTLGADFASVPKRILAAVVIDHIEARPTSVSHACLAALPCPQSTALRRISEMIGDGLLVRRRSATSDRRVILIAPTDKAIRLLAALLVR